MATETTRLLSTQLKATCAVWDSSLVRDLGDLLDEATVAVVVVQGLGEFVGLVALTVCVPVSGQSSSG